VVVRPFASLPIKPCVTTRPSAIYTTDPRVAPAAKRIDVIAFEEAAEMATFGAKVL
jgi:aspartate kinase